MRQRTQSLIGLVVVALFVTCSGTCALLNTAAGNWLPWGLIVLFFVAMTLGLVEVAQRDRRRASGRCLTCGYDLRASPHRCPECGTPVGKREPRA